jgi:hypothetical protein
LEGKEMEKLMIKIDPIKNIYPDVVALFFLFMVLFSSVTNAQSNLVTYSENQALAGEEIYAACRQMQQVCHKPK